MGSKILDDGNDKENSADATNNIWNRKKISDGPGVVWVDCIKTAGFDIGNGNYSIYKEKNRNYKKMGNTFSLGNGDNRSNAAYTENVT